MKVPFCLRPAPRGSGFSDPDWWIWCGSVVRGEDRRFHMFASRWSKRFPFNTHWVFSSAVVRAVADVPEGPYRFAEVVLARRAPHLFDGMNTHNPLVRSWDGKYWLFYMGTTHEFPELPPHREVDTPTFLAVWHRKRIGLAWSRSVFGPWQRLDQPLLEPRSGQWDATITSNPAAVIQPDGTTYLIYKSRAHAAAPLQLGIARAPHPTGPYRRLSDKPLFSFPHPDFHIEDPFLWHDGTHFHLLLKDDYKNDCGGITGEWGAGVYAWSEDGVQWVLGEPPKAYSRTIQWADGSVTTQPNLERPFLLVDESGRPTHLFCATGAGPKPWQFEHTWNQCIPLDSAGRPCDRMSATREV